MLKIHNTYSAITEKFKPIVENEVKMYVCGPTVYDNPHLGHARCYITWDVLYRYLKFSGYNVTYCRNVTDVDDKILKKADEYSCSPDEIAKKYYDVFSESMKNLNNLKPDIEPFATKTLGEMIKLTKELIEKGYAYEVDGDVYFRVKKFPKYGMLSKQPIDDLVAGARVETIDKKEDVLDFALWKKDEKHGYNSPWGLGRPGWHIECSAMGRKYLAPHFDIHAGGADLIFPHHENEIAQSECANGCTYVNYWMHNGFVTINKEKMSKSLKNFVTIADLLKDYNFNTIRLFILTNHYRMPVEFNSESLDAAKAGVKRLSNSVANFITKYGNILAEDIEESAKADFTAAMDDDLNTSKALSVLFDLANKTSTSVSADEKENAILYASSLVNLGNVLGLDLKTPELDEELLEQKLSVIKDKIDFLRKDDLILPAKKIMQKIIEYRQKVRAEKNYNESDRVRDILSEVGLTLKDTKDGCIYSI
ncbi:cysteine--tRNA ligase [bacterium]|nr:cysteine--tRNA ligase [bacterium]